MLKCPWQDIELHILPFPVFLTCQLLCLCASAKWKYCSLKKTYCPPRLLAFSIHHDQHAKHSTCSIIYYFREKNIPGMYSTCVSASVCAHVCMCICIWCERQRELLPAPWPLSCKHGHTPTRCWMAVIMKETYPQSHTHWGTHTLGALPSREDPQCKASPGSLPTLH